MKTLAFDIRRWIWKLDMSGMICLNEENKVIVKISGDENRVKGRILDMSMELFRRIARHKNGPKIIQQIIFAAENEYHKENSGCGRIDPGA